ncbi:Ribonuclease H2 subunit A [Clydaea vesicula]|uniref:Ribonuclease n=1 Tax=Clydaea vesicula TaxID=447962 RepID=A0AAD5TUV4_9FUNG|nr:Ribonuclease H2 subunit A [Clydaea vesicula]
MTKRTQKINQNKSIKITDEVSDSEIEKEMVIEIAKKAVKTLSMKEEDKFPDVTLNLDFIPTIPLTKSWNYHTPVPYRCINEDVIMGIDEAGRGPVLGPMVYAICYIPQNMDNEFKCIGVQDSKILNDFIRCSLFKGMQQKYNEYIGWGVSVLSPQDISEGMLRCGKYNLNAQAHDCTIDLIKKALNSGVKVKEIYIDTVGPPDAYRMKLEGIFPKLKIVVAKKADSLYATVSAASIFAKVTR